MVHHPAFFALLALFFCLTGPAPALGGALLIDLESHRTMAAENETDPVPAGESAAVMAVYAALREAGERGLELDQVPPLRTDAPKKDGKTPAEEKPLLLPTYETLFESALNEKKNVDLQALGQALGMDEQAWLERMNREASRLGLSARFGGSLLHEDTRITAADLARLSEALYVDFPFVRRWTSLEFLRTLHPAEKYQRPSRGESSFFMENAIRGVISGETPAGLYAVILFENPRSNGTMRRLLTVSMNAKTPEELSESLLRRLSAGYRDFETIGLYARGDVVDMVPVYLGNLRTVGLTVARDLFVTVEKTSLTREGIAGLRAEIRRPDPLYAPLGKDAPAGELVLYVDETEVGRSGLLALEEVRRGNFLSRFLDDLRLLTRR